MQKDWFTLSLGIIDYLLFYVRTRLHDTVRVVNCQLAELNEVELVAVLLEHGSLSLAEFEALLELASEVAVRLVAEY